jgi:hypothetical protein
LEFDEYAHVGLSSAKIAELSAAIILGQLRESS